MIERKLPEVSLTQCAERPVRAELLTYVYDTIRPRLISTRQQELDEVYPHSQYVMDQLSMKPESWKTGDVDAFETGMLFMGTVAHWGDEARIGSNKTFERQLAHIISAGTIAYRLEDAEETDYGVTDPVLHGLIEDTWPESATHPGNPVIWAKEQKARNGIVDLPYIDKAQQRAFYTVTDRLGITRERAASMDFRGVACPEEQVGFVWIDEIPRVFEHERQHLQHPGLTIGRVGAGLDEAVTDWRARQAVYGSDEGRWRQADPPHNHRYMLEFLYYKEPGLQKLLETRYEQKTMDASIQMVAGLINRYGLEGFKRLFFVHPHGDALLQDDLVGYESPYGILKHVLYPHDDPGFLPEPQIEEVADVIAPLIILPEEELDRRLNVWYELKN